MTAEFWGYDASFAIKVRKHMLYVPPEDEDYNELLDKIVWQPTKKFLLKLAEVKPKQVVCFFGGQFRFPRQHGALCSNLFIVNGEKEVAYLGTVFNRVAMKAYHQQLERDGIALTRRHGWYMIRDIMCLVIPSDRREIDEVTVIEAIQNALRSYRRTLIPELAEATIALLSQERGIALDEAIRQEAKRQAGEEP